MTWERKVPIATSLTACMNSNRTYYYFPAGLDPEHCLQVSESGQVPKTDLRGYLRIVHDGLPPINAELDMSVSKHGVRRWVEKLELTLGADRCLGWWAAISRSQGMTHNRAPGSFAGSCPGGTVCPRISGVRVRGGFLFV